MGGLRGLVGWTTGGLDGWTTGDRWVDYGG